MHNRPQRPERAREELPSIELPVRNSKVDEAKERVERRSEERQEISHAGDDFGEYERDGPDTRYHGGPDTPAYHGVAMCVVRLAHDAEVDDCDDL